jgi:uncharacterized protein (DUF362 family)
MSSVNGQPESFRPVVGIVRLPTCSYPAPFSHDDPVSAGLRRLAEQMQWADERVPFGRIIPRGGRVVIKPNLVLHQNLGSGGLDPLVTHPSLIRATVEAVLRTDAAEVVVGDAPLQSCDFSALLHATGLDSWASDLAKKEPRFKGIRDFRRTKCVVTHGVRTATEDCQPEERFALFNLAQESLLEPITDGRGRFRVSWYDSRRMARTHRPGVHQYLIARDVLEADLVINLPKLKTHKKAGVTCALKNSIGINGNKEYLPHHRLGGSTTGGDCYPGGSLVKLALERVADRQNFTTSFAMGIFWHTLAFGLSRVSRWRGDRFGIDGSWSGNDTIWRTCLDINRILLYGKPDASMAQSLQRRVIHVVDAVVAGQGDGPLAPDALRLGLLLGSESAVATDWVGALLLGYDPSKIHIISRTFEKFRWPLATFANTAVRVTGDLGTGRPEEVLRPSECVNYPIGWKDAAAVRTNGSSERTTFGSVVTSRAVGLTQPWDA